MVHGPPTADNDHLTVHIEWANPSNDWDVYVLDESGAIVARSAAYGDADEDALIPQTCAGALHRRDRQLRPVSRRLDDWRGEIRFGGPTPTTYGPNESWTFRCESPSGQVSTRQVTVDRGQTVDLGPTAC